MPSWSKGNQTMKPGQLIESNNIFFFKNYAENEIGRLVSDFFLFYKKSLHYCTSAPSPSFLLMILVQNSMVIKNHIETWVWKSTETKLFTTKVLKNLEFTMKKQHGLNTTILSPCWKINKLKNNITKTTQQ